MKITIWTPETTDITTLNQDEVTTVPTGLWHMFEALEDSVMLEFYLAEPLAEDIERRTVGGCSSIDKADLYPLEGEK
jgi:hypothetical protein